MDNHYDLGVDSAYVQLTWDEKPVGALGYSIDMKFIEIDCGVFSGGHIKVDAKGNASYDPNEKGSGGIGATLSGSAYLKLKGSCDVDVWFIDVGAGAEASGTIHLALEGNSTVDRTGAHFSGSLTTGVTLEGKAYAYIERRRI